MKKIGKTFLFLLFTFGISYSLAGLFYAFDGDYTTTDGVLLAIVYMFIPALSVLLVEKMVYREEIRNRMLISFKINNWFFIAWLLPLVLAFLTFGISLLFPGISYSPGSEGLFARFDNLLPLEQMDEMRREFEAMSLHPALLILFQGMIAGITVNAVAGFGEELGWRGFLVREFQIGRASCRERVYI